MVNLWVLLLSSHLITAEDSHRAARALLDRWRSQFSSPAVRAIDCGVPVDGVTDATAALNRCLETLPPFATLDGEGFTYSVTQIELRSELRLRRFRFVKRAGPTNHRSVLNLDGRRKAQRDVFLEDLSIDGRRAEETGIDSPSAEDGGRHCFRLVGQLSRIALVGVRGNFCGTDGLHLAGHHATLSDEPGGLPLQQIVVADAEFLWNRRMGLSFEGGHQLFFLNIQARFNGRVLEEDGPGPGGSPAAVPDWRSGRYCAHVEGHCFGSGVWSENDHDAAGGSFESVYFVRLRATENFRRGFYAFSQSHPAVSGFRPKSNLLIADSQIDAGVNPVPGNPAAVQFLAAGPDGAGTVFRQVRIQNTRVDGTISARAMEDLQLDNVWSQGPLLGFLEFFDHVEVRGGQRRGDFASSLWRRPDGRPGAAVRYLER